jgi:hypothetical protein
VTTVLICAWPIFFSRNLVSPIARNPGASEIWKEKLSLVEYVPFQVPVQLQGSTATYFACDADGVGAFL